MGYLATWFLQFKPGFDVAFFWKQFQDETA